MGEGTQGVLGAGLYGRGPKAESERDSGTETRDRDKAGQERGRTEAGTQWRQGHRGPAGRERSGIGDRRGAEAPVLAGGGVTAPSAGSGRGGETSVAEPRAGLWTSVVAPAPLGEPERSLADDRGPRGVESQRPSVCSQTDSGSWIHRGLRNRLGGYTVPCRKVRALPDGLRHHEEAALGVLAGAPTQRLTAFCRYHGAPGRGQIARVWGIQGPRNHQQLPKEGSRQLTGAIVSL